MKPRLYLLDASGYVYRAFFSLPEMTNPAGQAVNAVYGFTRMVLALLNRLEREGNGPDYVGAVFDPAGGRSTSFRREIDANYKANRPPMKPEMAGQFGMVRDAARAIGLPVLEAPGFEADDLIASYAQEGMLADMRVVVVSSDKDLMQLVTIDAEPQGSGTVRMWDPIKGAAIGPAEVRAKFGVNPDRVVDVQALIGDKTDNVPGVPGIGAKTAAEIINSVGSLERALADPNIAAPTKRIAGLLAAFKDDAERSKRLVTLTRTVPLPAPLPELEYRGFARKTLWPFLEHHDFKSIMQDLTTGALA